MYRVVGVCIRKYILALNCQEAGSLSDAHMCPYINNCNTFTVKWRYISINSNNKQHKEFSLAAWSVWAYYSPGYYIDTVYLNLALDRAPRNSGSHILTTPSLSETIHDKALTNTITSVNGALYVSMPSTQCCTNYNYLSVNMHIFSSDDSHFGFHVLTCIHRRYVFKEQCNASALKD